MVEIRIFQEYILTLISSFNGGSLGGIILITLMHKLQNSMITKTPNNRLVINIFIIS